MKWDASPMTMTPYSRTATAFKKGFSEILKACNLKTDYRGVSRTTYSLRHYYISEMIAKGVDVYEIARNTRTSIAMIDKHYGQVSVERLKDKLRPGQTEW
jgi:site-specific recombinase XerD